MSSPSLPSPIAFDPLRLPRALDAAMAFYKANPSKRLPRPLKLEVRHALGAAADATDADWDKAKALYLASPVDDQLDGLTMAGRTDAHLRS